MTQTPRGVLSTELVDVLFEEAGVGLCLVAPDGVVARANAGWLRYHGRGAGELLGAEALGLEAPALDGALCERARAGERVGVPPHARRIDGRDRWWDGRISPVQLAGGTGLLVAARELAGEPQGGAESLAAPREAAPGPEAAPGKGRETGDLQAEEALRRSEAALAQAERMAHVGAWWIEIADPDDLSSSPLRWSDEVYRIFGYAPGEVEVTTALFFERTHPDDREPVREAFARALARGGPYTLERRVVRPDGTERAVLDHAEVAFDGDGRPRRIVGAVQDVTDQRRAEEALREADRQKDEFLAILAHELRNPLSAISGATHLIRARLAQGQDVQRPLEILERQTRNSGRLLDELLDVSRITRGLVRLRREEVRLDTVVASAVESQRALVDSAAQTLSITLPDHPVYVEGDPTRLEQIVANLVNNASKYTPERGRLCVGVEPRDGEVLLRVQDDGVGISPQLLPRVFDQFVQGEQSLARSMGGLGLGLTLVRRLVELHGGSIQARSEGAGRGSEFVVRLPLKAHRRSSGLDRDGGPPGSGLRRRILVVEDNRDAAEVLADYLRSVGHEVEVAHDGPAAIDAATRGAGDVVLLDIGLPGMDGYEVARRLRELVAPRPPVLIALTGYAQEEDRRRARESGFAYHLAKPFEPDALERLLGRIGAAHPDG